MGRPYKIILVRHGESVGNVDKSVYETMPDWRIPLTDKGKDQALKAGYKIADIVAPYYHAFGPPVYPWAPPTAFYVSPWTRTRQTYEVIRQTMDRLATGCKMYEDPRLREQEWGNYQTEEALKKVWKERDGFGKFFYRMPDGESGADVYNRVSTFLESLHRDFQKKNFPETCIIVTHGLTMRVLLMRWFHWSVEEYDSLCNPPNGGIVVMRYEDQEEKYFLDTKLRKKKLPYKKR